MPKRNEIGSLHAAVLRHSLPESAAAISAGADVNARDLEGRTALFYACMDGEETIVDALIRANADVNLKDKAGETPLHFAARFHRERIAEQLLRAGAAVDPQDTHGNTPLWRAVFESKGRGEMIALLLSCGADRSLENNHGVSPLGLAQRIGNFNVHQFFA